MFLSGLAIVLFGLGFFTVFLGGDVFNFLDLASLICMLCFLLAVLAATQSFKVFYIGLRAAVFPKEEISEEMRGRAASLFRLLSKTTAMASAISVLICFVNLLMNLDFADKGGIQVLGINIAASLISLLYGLLLIAAVFEPVVFILKKRSSGRR